MSRFTFEDFDDEKLPLSDQEVIDALINETEGSLELFKKWYDQNAPKDSPDNTSRDNILFAVRVGEIYFKSDNILDAHEAFNDARSAAMLEDDEAFFEEVEEKINTILGNNE